jgi:hypothetical protein
MSKSKSFWGKLRKLLKLLRESKPNIGGEVGATRETAQKCSGENCHRTLQKEDKKFLRAITV